MYDCPVCGYGALQKPPRDHSICPCCGVEFGLDDAGPCRLPEIHASLRRRWVARNAKWHSRRVSPPHNWNAWSQLIKANFFGDIPWRWSIVPEGSTVVPSLVPIDCIIANNNKVETVTTL